VLRSHKDFMKGLLSPEQLLASLVLPSMQLVRMYTKHCKLLKDMGSVLTNEIREDCS
jgi:hypothetical protein